MEFKWKLDFTSPRIFQVSAAIPGHSPASGSGLLITNAMERCRSEWIERMECYRLQEQSGGSFDPVGMAAHPNPQLSERNARFEALEQLVLDGWSQQSTLIAEPIVENKTFSIFAASIGPDFCFAFVRGVYNGQPFATSAVSDTKSRAITKAWDEYRKVFRAKPSRNRLSTWTRANKMFPEGALLTLNLDATEKSLQWLTSYVSKKLKTLSIRTLKSTVHQKPEDARWVSYLERTN